MAFIKALIVTSMTGAKNLITTGFFIHVDFLLNSIVISYNGTVRHDEQSNMGEATSGSETVYAVLYDAIIFLVLL